jgi:hypothetical protein
MREILVAFWVSQSKVIQGDTGGKVYNLAGGSSGHCENKDHTNKCLIMNCYRDTAV